MPDRFHNKKGQAILIDLLIGVNLFLVILIVCMAILDNGFSTIAEQQNLLQQQKKADTTLLQLISTTGSTNNGKTSWENAASLADVKFIGLALSDRVILPAKINKFIEYARNNYDETKDKLLLPYDFYFRLVDAKNGGVLKACNSGENCEAGKTEFALAGEGKKIYATIVSRRIVAFNGVSAIAEIQVFRTQKN